ncbi:unnamed protein product [Mycena citricolor]|uniref:Conserved oligomeric Golgi complex subunit 1 n=1 Tax=Mycena citricolor TaxID=2018698 RepID=A0AAD2HQS1_9AGAR|nr:unnamed protein product [Mycena citricolor]
MFSRRPSTLSVYTPPPSSQGTVKIVQTDDLPEAPALSRQVSASTSKIPYVSELDPDELFTKRTIAEVKVAQNKLRADADAKQEELRLMVGERYRDLLHASTSIIAIASSSHRVIEALNEAKDVIMSQAEPPVPQRMSSYRGGDGHLHTLQLLAAHMKLLLDAPEYLWRLMERKRYFTAAWLFLLALVVHHALVRSDDQDEDSWQSQGIDVLVRAIPTCSTSMGSYPPIPFSNYTSSNVVIARGQWICGGKLDICAAVLSLHLLDSRPLSEALSLFLSQRSKTLQGFLSRKAEGTATSPSVGKSNGHVPEKVASKSSLKEVKEITQAAVVAVVDTIRICRAVFQDSASKSMVAAVLEYIHSDSTQPDNKALSSELMLTTESLLVALPSSTQFLLLPPALRSYKPHVNLSSSSSMIDPVYFTQTLDSWFQSSNGSLEVAVSKWFSELHLASDVWSLRLSIWRWITIAGLADTESEALKSMFDRTARQRVLDIWAKALGDAQTAFKTQLEAATASIRTTQSVTSSAQFLFNAPALPVMGAGHADVSFEKYQQSLRQQLLGRTALLDGVLLTLENCARSLQRDFAIVHGGDTDDRATLSKLTEEYQPHADELCAGILDTLSSAENSEDDNDTSVNTLVFLSHIADELVSSIFISGIRAGEQTVQDFQRRAEALRDRIIDRWRSRIVAQIISQQTDRPTLMVVSPAPSPALIEALLKLSTSIQELTRSRNVSPEPEKTLRHFITEWVAGSSKREPQSHSDIVFLRYLASLYRTEWDDLCSLLDAKAQECQEHSELEMPMVESGASEYLTRTQTLFAPLLPVRSRMLSLDLTTDKMAPLLPFGSPPTGMPFQSAVEVAKTSARFGLLLVGTV